MAGERPDFIASTVVGDGEQSRWREIGAAWRNERSDGESFTILIDSVPLSGKIILLPPKEAEAGVDLPADEEPTDHDSTSCLQTTSRPAAEARGSGSSGRG